MLPSCMAVLQQQTSSGTIQTKMMLLCGYRLQFSGSIAKNAIRDLSRAEPKLCLKRTLDGGDVAPLQFVRVSAGDITSSVSESVEQHEERKEQNDDDLALLNTYIDDQLDDDELIDLLGAH